MNSIRNDALVAPAPETILISAVETENMIIANETSCKVKIVSAKIIGLLFMIGTTTDGYKKFACVHTSTHNKLHPIIRIIVGFISAIRFSANNLLTIVFVVVPNDKTEAKHT